MFNEVDSFMRAKSDLRLDALKGCARDNVATKRLVTSNPFLPELFDPVDSKKVIDQAQLQMKSPLAIMGFIFLVRETWLSISE